MSPFFVDYSRDMRTLILPTLSPLATNYAPALVRLLRKDAKRFANNIRTLYEHLNEELT